MSKNEPPTAGSLDYYREKAESDPDIAALVGMIDRLKQQLTAALEQLAKP